MNKLDRLMNMINGKIPEQLVGLENMLTAIRHKVIKPMQEAG